VGDAERSPADAKWPGFIDRLIVLAELLDGPSRACSTRENCELFAKDIRIFN
jgi:hypothetical protein